ncbi:membrane protein [Tengunoibacter tsumagoiensis]|uniref:Membrane protein n=2 Tax=Tengunoibacter tsumagoiensis TaxID=2014871 RepID=A0A402A9B6_9CHLR|nr:membrane protein [Tengunoibacter tsumagoiensis]
MVSTNQWWLAMIAGIALFIVGLLFLISPKMSLIVLVQLLGTYWLIVGILTFVSLSIDRTLWGWKIVEGTLGVLAGLLVIRDPLWSALFVPAILVLFLAIEALLMGGAQIVHGASGGGLGLIILGVLNVIFGVILFFNPLLGAVALPIMLGIFAIIGGSTLAIRAFLSRPQASSVNPLGTQPA